MDGMRWARVSESKLAMRRFVVRVLVYKIATQAAQEEGPDRATAKAVGARMVRRLTEW